MYVSLRDECQRSGPFCVHATTGSAESREILRVRAFKQSTRDHAMAQVELDDVVWGSDTVGIAPSVTQT